MNYYKVDNKFDRTWMVLLEQNEGDLLRPSSVQYDAYLLNPEVRKWCNSIFANDWGYKIKKIEWEYASETNTIPKNVVEFTFRTEEDMLMFTMRWVGGKSE